MTAILGRISPHVYAVLRIVAGLLFVQHGAQKLFGAFGSEPVQLASLMGLAGVIELVCGAMIALGFLGPIAALISSAEMVAAYVLAHARQSPWPIVNKGEVALLFCFIFLYVAAHGSGIWSLDALIARSRAHPRGGARPSEPITGVG